MLMIRIAYKMPTKMIETTVLSCPQNYINRIKEKEMSKIIFLIFVFCMATVINRIFLLCTVHTFKIGFFLPLDIR